MASSPTFDLVVRGGLIFDGRGGEPFYGDVAVQGQTIVSVGEVGGSGTEEVDARGLIVTPGFVDIHTHYDGQVTWESGLSPSSSHGVTTVVMGNCGVGFAPCKPDDRDCLIELMAGVEDIPEVVMADGLPWTWETYPEYLDVVGATPHELNIASYLPHSALRVYVMGQRAIERQAATPEDIERMADIMRAAARAGAIGFATSRFILHKTAHGELIPTVRSGEDELLAIAVALQESGGVLQLISDFENLQGIEKEFALLKRVSKVSGIPLFFSLFENPTAPEVWPRLLEMTAQANADGAQIRTQIMARPPGVLLGFELSYNPFSGCPSYQAIAELAFEERIEILASPKVRAALLEEEPVTSGNHFVDGARRFDIMYALGDPPNYEPEPCMSIGSRARASGCRPQELAYDTMMEQGGRGLLIMTSSNYAYGSLESCLTMMRDPNAVLGLGDGGAHYGLVCDASWPTTMLVHWTRDRTRGEKVSLAWIIHLQTQRTAAAVGLRDRGVLAAGYRADINVIDYDNLRLRAPRVTYDLPGGGRRLVQSAEGYVATIVNGVIARRNDQPTGALPGILVRGSRPQPTGLS